MEKGGECSETGRHSLLAAYGDSVEAGGADAFE